MTYNVCDQCKHTQYLHDAWGICGVLACKPCHLELDCPRCGHSFNDHTVSDNIVFCAKRSCDYVTCYNKACPDKPLMRAAVIARRPVLPLPPANAFNPPLYESMLPARYRDIPIVRVIPPDPVEKGYVDE